MPKRTNNPYTDTVINEFKCVREEDLPYKAIGDTVLVIPMEVKDDLPTTLILTPGVNATDSARMQSRLLKGKVISVGEGVVGFERFILPDRPQLGDVVYFEAHMMKVLPHGFGLVKFESCLFVLDDDKEAAKKILENDKLHAAKQDQGLRPQHTMGLGVGQKF